MSFKYPLATTTWDNAEYDAMQKVIASGMFTMGQHVAAYEKEFADYFGARHAVMVNSGSSANLLMVGALFFTQNAALKLNAGDEVIVPAVSWSTTYHPLQQYGLHVKFVDIDLHTLNFDLQALEAAITPRTRMIFAVNLLGNPNNFAAIQKIIAGKNIVLMEDNCESMGATFEGKQAGTFGVMGSYSSFFSHHISTMEGGMIVTDDEELYHILLSMRAHGWTRNLPKHNRVTGVKSDDPFEESFKFVLPGYNVRPLELSGALGIEQLKKLPDLVANRRKNGALFQEAFKNHPQVMIQQETGESSWFGFSLIIKPGADITRKQLIEKLNAGGFECRPIVAGNFAKNECVKYFSHEVHGQLKNAEHLDGHGLFIGNHHYPLVEAIADLKTALRF
ncbi:DegT/DnrJ/EryC1/StrS family aminotransferase [Limnobacter sp.]|uniref:DegT/DnrJ/EryC1/StrS family aminotransferase n=1 Tax=Limnobacter sp. TaxID=2003368 RepID=UPI00351974EA